MAAAHHTGSKKNLTCGVCQDIYQSPRFLPCHHTFCQVCIEGLVNSARGRPFSCPVCRKPTAVPAGGLTAFQANYYITEEELEQARNHDDAAMCSTHTMEQLIFFCEQCDKAICLRCKLTSHEGHKTKDLQVVAADCKRQLSAVQSRLEGSIGRLSKLQVMAQDNLREAEKKRIAVKEQVHSQRDLLVARINTVCDTVLQDIDKLADALEGELQKDTEDIQRKLLSLLELQESVQHALSDACDAVVVATEKKTRESQCTEEALAALENDLPTTTKRPCLYSNVSSVTDQDIADFIGVPVTLNLASTSQTESISQVFRCGEDGSLRKVHTVCPFSHENVCAAFGGTAPLYKKELCAVREQCTFDFDANSTGELFAVVEQDRNGTNKTTPILGKGKKRKMADDSSPGAGQGEGKLGAHSTHTVRLYRGQCYEAVAKYAPPELPFHPTDVCFCQIDGAEKLVVADYMNDRLHVVRVDAAGTCQFERYLAAGSGYLVKPTTLNTDVHGNLWIGCANGWVLQCKTVSS
ncbi:hypothetical protein BaRGS_00028726 [Batillaria attramentaria]|uniref:Uncharacterized protein n=1 Tax=Batillaria attramentaria TaxID=370345 RepID=A0ABD0JYK6_9CAEN